MYPFVVIGGLMTLTVLVAAVRRRGPAQLLALVLWGAYTVYEYYVANGTLCDANCNIRVDLVLFIPLLAGAAYLAFKEEPSVGATAMLYAICLGLVALGTSMFGYPVAAAIAGVGALVAVGLGLKAQFARAKS
jgi:hypothetical protein